MTNTQIQELTLDNVPEKQLKYNNTDDSNNNKKVPIATEENKNLIKMCLIQNNKGTIIFCHLNDSFYINILA